MLPSSMVMNTTRSVVSTRLTSGAIPSAVADGGTTVGGGASRSFGGFVVVVVGVDVDGPIEVVDQSEGGRSPPRAS